MTDNEYNEAMTAVTVEALKRVDGDFKAAIDLLCDAIGLIAADNNTTVSGADDRIADTFESFTDVYATRLH